MNIHLQQSSKHIPMSETILETIRTLNIQAQKYSESQKEVAYSYSLDAKNLATSYLSQLGTNSEIPLSSSIDDESFVRAVKKELVVALSNLSNIYYYSNEFHKALEVIEEGILYSQECALELQTAQMLLIKGNVCFQRCEFIQSLQWYEQAYEFLRFHTSTESVIVTCKVLNNIGNIYKQAKDHLTALEYFQKSLVLKTQYSIPIQHFAMEYLNIGTCYKSLKEFNLAYEYFEKAHKIAIETNDTACLGVVLNNFGDFWCVQNDVEKAMTYFNKSIAIKKSLHSEFGLDITLYNIATVLATERRYSESVQFIEEGIVFAKKQQNNYVLAYLYLLYAEISCSKVQTNFSIEFAKECLSKVTSLPIELHNEELQRDILKISAMIEEMSGNNLTALQLFKEYTKVEKQFEVKQFEIKEKLLRDQLEYERKKSNDTTSTETTIQIEALRKENANISALLERTKENVTTLLEQKNDLIRMASHDLKNPLNNILGFAEYLLKEIPLISTDDIKEYATYIRDSAQRMTTIITTILDVNKSGTSTINVTLQKTDVATIVQTLLREYSQYAQSKNITVTQNIHAQRSICETDSDLLKQIIDNIFSNAIKYSPLGSKVSVTIRSQDNIVTNNEEKTVESVVIVEIEDKGPGFTEDDRINMFGTYAKLSAKPTAGEHSTGLGLSIVKKLSELINVSVWCESTVGEGSTFFIEIPELHK